MVNPYDFAGKKIMVTGASSGMGRSTAIMLSEQGAQVVLLGRDVEALRATQMNMCGNNHVICVVDLLETEDLTQTFVDIMLDGKKLDGLVHCAGVLSSLPLNSIKRYHINECMSVNFSSFIELTKQFSKKKNHDGGSIVAVSSMAAMMPGKCQTLYAASKAALNVAIQSLAMELVNKNIRINGIMPSFTNTKMLQEIMDNIPSEFMEDRIQQQLLGVTRPEEIASTILFLLSDASSCITGRCMYADGGSLI